jgi:hypothetical protein
MKFTKSLSMARQSGVALTVMLGLAMSSVLSTGAQAEEARKPQEQTRSVYLVKYWIGDQVRYNKNPLGKVLKVSALKYMNSSPYVCTPSGFGQKARCRAI